MNYYEKERKKILIERIKSSIDNGLVNDKDIVYFMASIRNLLDLKSEEEVGRTFSTLNFFCNWVLHPVLDKTSEKEIIKFTENYFSESNSIRIKKGLAGLSLGAKKGGYRTYVSERWLSMSLLKEQIIVLFNQNRIETDFIKRKHKWWAKFRRVLQKTLSFSSYISKNKKSLIQSVTLVFEDSYCISSQRHM